jgi:hypothetical protein
VFNRKGKIYNEYVRLSLKEELVNLPSSHFAQIHRSYAVNLQHVKHIKKEGQAYKLSVGWEAETGMNKCISYFITSFWHQIVLEK